MSADPFRLPVVQGNRHHAARPVTVSMARLSKRALDEGAAMYPERPGVDYQRPRTFADCDAADLGASVPCPFVSCKHHVALDVNERAGSIKSNFPDRDPDEIPHTCTLRVAERGGATLDDVAAVMNLTRERVRQIQDIALAKLRHALGDAAVRDLIDASEDRLAAIDARAAQYGEVETWSREYAPPVRAGDGADEVADAGGVRLW